VLGLNSLRGIEKNFEILELDCSGSKPNFNTIRQWALRLGLYELNRIKEVRKDWIFILDMTIELGAAKCLVILGISQEKLTKIIQEEKRSLQHLDVEVLSLEILEKSSGIIISEKINNVAIRVGTPIQIVSDRGSDVLKGINLYRENNAQVIATYDVTHKMANLLKKELSGDEHFSDFLKQCSLTRQRVQQTSLYFLIPPKQRSKARYHNVDTLIEWAIKILEYEKKQDFSLISTIYVLDDEALNLLRSTLSADMLISLKGMTQHIYENRQEFTKNLVKCLGEESWLLHGEIICQYADLGRRKFYTKLGWLLNYQQSIYIYAEILLLINTVQTQLKTQGLHRESLTKWLETIATHSLSLSGQKLKDQILEYLTIETNQVPSEQILLGSSDVIESIFGKYKLFAAKRPLKDIGTSILLIPLSTLKITTDLVKQAMENISFKEVVSWAKSIFGSSMLSQRRTLKLVPQNDMKPA